MILDCSVPEIVIPSVLDVAVHSGETISYKDDTFYYRIKREELMH